MAHAEGHGPTGDAHRAQSPSLDVDPQAQLAGLRSVPIPTLEEVERRRTELIGIAVFLAFACGLAVLFLAWDPLAALESSVLPVHLLGLTMLVLASSVAVYLIRQERRLRRTTKALLNERVVAAALLNRLREISLLSEAGRAVSSTLDLRSTLTVILGAASELLEADEGSIMLLDDDEHLVVAAASGNSSPYVGQRSHVTDGVAGFVIRNRQPLCLQGELEMTEFADVLGGGARGPRLVRSALLVPLEAQDEIFGVLNLNVTTSERQFEEYDSRTLELFAQQAAVAIYQARFLASGGTGMQARLADLQTLHADALNRIAHPEAPVLDVQTTSPQPSSERTRPHRGRGTHLQLLLVDDDPGLLRLLNKAFTDAGFETALASDGATALERVKRERPDLLLLDLQIPVLDGWQVLEQLRGDPKRPKIICLTGKSGRRDRIRAWTLGADEYVQKPFHVESLLEVAREVAARSTEQQEERSHAALAELYAAR